MSAWLMDHVLYWLSHLPATMLSLTIWLFGLAAVFVPLERLAGLHRQPALRPQLLADLGYYFLTGLLPTLVLAAALGLVGTMARQIAPDGYYQWTASLPLAVQIIAAFFVGEIGFYWGHRAMHEVPWLWRFHATHHEPERMDWLINSRANPIDIIFTRLCGVTLIVIAGFGSPGSETGSIAPMLVLFAGIFWSFFIHSNIGWRLGWIEQVVSTPHFHHWHHSRDDHVNHNYASMLPFYDRLFGTYHMPDGAWPARYGIAPENRPETVIAGRRADAPAE